MKIRKQNFVLLERPLKALTGEDLHYRLKNMIESVTSEISEKKLLSLQIQKIKFKKSQNA